MTFSSGVICGMLFELALVFIFHWLLSVSDDDVYCAEMDEVKRGEGE
jgi:hypothetical protein